MCVSDHVCYKIPVGLRTQDQLPVDYRWSRLVIDGNGINFVRFLGGLNAMLAWYLARGRLSTNISND